MKKILVLWTMMLGLLSLSMGNSLCIEDGKIVETQIVECYYMEKNTQTGMTEMGACDVKVGLTENEDVVVLSYKRYDVGYWKEPKEWYLLGDQETGEASAFEIDGNIYYFR